MNPFTPRDQGSYQQQPQHRRDLTPFAQAAFEVAGGTALLGLGAFLLIGVWAVYVVAPLPAAVLAVVALGMGVMLMDTTAQSKGNRWTMLLAGGAALIATVWGVAAITAFSYQPVAVPGFIATALYGAALAAGVWKELDRVERIFAALLGLLMISVATSVLVIPAGREEATGEPPGFTVDVVVEDQRWGDMRTQVVANCSLFDAWAVARGAVPGVDPKVVDETGRAGPWKFPFGHPFKAVVCTVVGQRQSGDSVSEGSAEDEGARGVSRSVYFPLPGGAYTVRVMLFNDDRL